MKRRPLSDGLQPQDGDGILREGEVETALHGAQGLGVRDHRLVVLDAAAEAEGSFAEARALGTAVMQYGYRIIDDLIASRGVAHVEDLVGEELPYFVRASDLDRSTIVYPVVNRDTCIGCGRCYISCRDGGHQAITFGEDRKPHIVGSKCVGCHLCYLICPTDSIGLSKRVPKRK